MNGRSVITFLFNVTLTAIVTVAVGALVILPPFLSLEQKELMNNLDRCQVFLQKEAQALLVLTKDWATWDASYEFVQDRNQSYIEENLEWGYLSQDLDLDALYVVDVDGQIIWGKTHSISPEASDSFAKIVIKSILPQGQLYENVLGGEEVAGFMPTPHGIWLVTGKSILPNSGEGPARGVMLMARTLTSEDYKAFSSQLKIDFKLEAVKNQSLHAETDISESPSRSSFQMEDSERAQAFRPLADLLGHSSLRVSLEIPRAIHKQGLRATYIGGFLIFGLGVILSFLLAKLVNQNRHLMKMQRQLVDSLEAKTQALEAYEIANTERSFLETKLRQKYKMEALGTMAGGIAHDFNNILAIILGNATLLQQSSPEEDPNRKRIDNLMVAASRAIKLVKQILSFSRQEKPLLKPIDLSIAIEKTIDLLSSTIPASIEINKNIEPGLWINADETQFQQTLLNLFSNATHAMNDHGIITLVLEKQVFSQGDLATPHEKFSDHCAYLSINDNGTGMSAEVLERIFDPFFTTKQQKGTGMGLSVVRGIVENHHGTIEVESAINMGSTFHIYFPICDSEEANTPEESTLPSTGTENILVVDDENMLIEAIGEMLEELGYKVSAEICSKNALDLVRSCPDHFDLVITDKAMPMLSGDELAINIREVNAEIPIILCSGYHEESVENLKKSPHINAYCSKPLSMKELANTVRQVLDEAKR